jgi:hypothetical protein
MILLLLHFGALKKLTPGAVVASTPPPINAALNTLRLKYLNKTTLRNIIAQLSSALYTCACEMYSTRYEPIAGPTTVLTCKIKKKTDIEQSLARSS